MEGNVLAESHILITGGAGLIGTASRGLFESRGWRVTTLDIEKMDLDGRVIDHIGDIVTIERLTDRLSTVDGILHLAAVSRVIDAEFDQDECTRVNVGGTQRLLRAASEAECKWFIFGSSREVYGEPTVFPVKEEIGVNPINHYGRAKVLGESMVRDHCEANGMVHSSLRFSNVYGHPGDHETRLIIAFVRRAMLSQPLEIHGGGQVFDFTYLDDTVEAIFATAEILQQDHRHLPPIHVLPGEAVAIEELAHLIIEITGSDSEIVYTPGRDYDVERFHGDPSLMQHMLNYSCPTDIRTGIKRCIEAHREKLLLNGGDSR